jgi:hypothetical protein
VIEIRLTFPTAAEAADALAKMAGVIAPADRPDAGVAKQLPLPLAAAVPVPLAATPSAASVFGGAAAPSVPVPPPAPSTAVVAPPPTAPAAPTAGSPPLPPVGLPPAPPTVPAAAAPAAPAAPTSPAGIELDSEGVPWDGRIHGSTKAKNADGTWRQKRGLNDPALKKRVEAELKAALAAGTLTAAAAAPVAPPPVVVPPAPPAAAVAPPPAAVAETFPTLIARLTPHLRPDRLTDARIAQVLASLGQNPPITGIAQLAVRPDLVPAAGAAFDAVLASLPGA